MDELAHHDWARSLCRTIFRVFAVDIRVFGESEAFAVAPSPRILVARHVSPATLALIRATCPGRLAMLVAGRVATWPVLGRLSQMLGNIHVRPGSDAAALQNQINERIAQGYNVVIPVARPGLAIPPGGLVPRDPIAVLQGCQAPWTPVAVSGLAALWPPYEVAPQIGAVSVFFGAVQPPLGQLPDETTNAVVVREKFAAVFGETEMKLAEILAAEVAPRPIEKEPIHV